MYYNEKQIKNIINLYELCGFNVLYTIPEYLSTALNFAYENNYKFDENEIIYVFTDIGYINTSSTVVKYKKDYCEVLSHSYNKEFGGRFIDSCILDDIKKNLDSNIEIYNKLHLRLCKGVEELKCKLSAIGADEVPISIDNGDDTIDIIYSIKKINNVLIENKIFEEFKNIIVDSLNKSGINDYSDIKFVVCGQSTRIPYIQNNLENFIENELKCNEKKILLTINREEFISTGNCYYYFIKKGIWNYNYNDSRVKPNLNDSSNIFNTNKYDSIKKSLEEICNEDLLIKNIMAKRNSIEKNMY